MSDKNVTSVEPDAGSERPKPESDTECERLRADVGREHDLYLRALADFENYRRRVERDRAKEAAAFKRNILLSLVDVVDSFERALPHVAACPESVAKGIQAIHRRMLDILDSQGVQRIEAVEKPFDPTVHEAIGAAPSDDTHPPGTVVEEIQPGYRLGEEVVRPARVRVAR